MHLAVMMIRIIVLAYLLKHLVGPQCLVAKRNDDRGVVRLLLAIQRYALRVAHSLH